jgi:uncharacterized membrane protein YebE (DUF533 family)
MFLKDLTDAEKKAFVCLANKIVVADGVVSAGEKAFMDNLDVELGLPAGTAALPEAESFKVAAAAAPNKKRAFYVELFSLVAADGVDAKEKVCMKEIQTKLGLADAFVTEAEDWLAGYLESMRKGFALVG